jgi:hypothetical protein
MPKRYRAVNTIRYGVGEEQADGTVRQTGVKVFEPGDVVSGLPREEMKQLWEAGVLEQEDVPETNKTATTTEAKPQPAPTQEETEFVPEPQAPSTSTPKSDNE